MSEHTPGPWGIVESASSDDYYELRVESKDGTFVADCDGSGDFEMQRANARLIAAAPQMLEACRAALAELRRRLGESDPGAYRDIVMLREAIAAATDEGGHD